MGNFFEDLWDAATTAVEDIVDFVVELAEDIVDAVVGGILSLFGLDDLLEDFEGTLITKTGNVSLLPVVYGERTVGGVWVYTDVTGADNAYIHLVFALADGDSPINSIVSIFIDDVLHDNSKYSGLVTVETTLGDHTSQPFTSLQSDSGPWTSSHKLLGTAAVAVRLKWDQEVWRGLPRFTFKLQGSKVYDLPAIDGNLLIRAREFDDAIWQGAVTVTADTDAAPDGTITADTLEDFSASTVWLNQTITIDVTKTYLFNVYIKRDSVGVATRFCELQLALLGSTVENYHLALDTLTGDINDTKFGPDPNFTFGIDKSDPVYWRLWMYAKSDDVLNTSGLFRIFPARGAGTLATLNAATQGSIVCGGAQVTEGTSLPFFYNSGATAKGPGTRIYSVNPAEILFDYLTNSIYGKGLSITDGVDIDIQSFVDARSYANDSITSYSGGPAHTRMECNMVLQSGVKILDNIKVILASCRGTLPYINGLFYLVIEKHYPPADYGLSDYFDFNTDNIIGSWSFKSGDVNSRFNRVVVTYPNEALEHKPDEVIVESAAFRAADGRLLEKKIQLRGTTNVYRAIDTASVLMRRSRQQLVSSFTATIAALQVRAGTIVTITHETPGWNLKQFRVSQIKLLKSGNCRVRVVEHDSTIYDLTLPNEVPTSPDTNLPDPTSVPDITNVVPTSDESVLDIKADGTLITRLYLTWDIPANIFVNGYDVEYKLSADSIYLPGGSPNSIGNNEVYIPNVIESSNYDFRVRATNSGGYNGAWNETTAYNIIGKTSNPADATGFIHTILKSGVTLSWDSNADSDIGDYEVRVGGTDWDSASLVARTDATQLLVGTLSTGVTTYRLKARDTGKRLSDNAVTTLVTVSDPAAPVVSHAIVVGHVRVTWLKPASTFTVVAYILSYTHPIDGLKQLGTVDTTYLTFEVDWIGSATFHVSAVDIAGNTGPEGDEVVVVAAPTAITLTAQVIDNNVLLNWTDAANTLPIDKYELRKGSTYGGSTFIAFQQGTYAFLFEISSGDFTYWVTGVDSAGNFGVNNSITAAVNEPPDYVLQSDQSIDLTTGSYINVFVNQANALNFLVNLTETWTEHFNVNNSFASPQAQIDAGYPHYIQPTFAYTDTITDISSKQCTVASTTGLSTGFKVRIAGLAVAADEGVFNVASVDDSTHFTVTEAITNESSATASVKAGSKYETLAIDYGTILGNLSITATLTAQIIDGDPDVFVKIRISDDDISYTDFLFGENKVFAESFRYVKVVIEVSGDSGEDLYEVSNLQVVVNVKEITESGTTDVTSATLGTVVTFVKTWIDITSIIATPIVPGAGTTDDFTAIVDFLDAPNPVDMELRLYKDGVQQSSGKISWIIRGH